MRIKFLLIQSLLFFGCGSKREGENTNISKRDSLLHEQQLAKEYRNSGKGLYIENCASCHNFSMTEDGRPPFIDIVKTRSSSWTYKLLTDSSFDFKSIARSASDKKLKNNIQFPDMSESNIDSIWHYAIKERGTISY